MLYPVYVHKDGEGTAHGAIVPDFPGCFSAADTLDGLPAMVQEAIEVFCEGEDIEIPGPSDLSDLIDNDEYTEGTWMFIDVDVDALDTSKQRINITVPTYALREIDDYVAVSGGNRSGFLWNTALNSVRGDRVMGRKAARTSVATKGNLVRKEVARKAAAVKAKIKAHAKKSATKKRGPGKSRRKSA